MTIEQTHHERLKDALLVIRQLRERADSLERAASEPIAIVGLGCRFPGAIDPGAFWQLLQNGVDAIREVPADRWNVEDLYDPDPEAPGKMYTRRAGFLDDIDLFDPQFFGIAPREAISMDPQQRLLLEVSWEALEHAGIAADRLVQSRTGIFVGLMNFDFAYLQAARGPSSIDAYQNSGVAPSIAAGRLSYVLGFQGPCMTVDTACSSSLVTVHLACQSLRAGECDLALAGGVNAILTPTVMLGECKARMLSRDGHCKTFDASADGFGRGEGCGIVALKRLSDARRDGDQVLALIRGSAVNQDGNSQGLTAPNGPSQQRVIRQALARGNLKPDAVQYVEAHGTGTALGDPIEVQALAAVYGLGRAADRPLWIGSVKTNFGHLEGAAGVASLIKAVLSLQHEEIPPHLHCSNLTPHISWDRIPVKVATERIAWPRREAPRAAGVSSFGFSGTNVHVVLEEAPRDATSANENNVNGSLPESAWHVLALSAKSESALEQLTQRYAKRLTEEPELAIADVCYTANTGRSHFERRTALVVSSREDAAAQLAAWNAGASKEGVWQGTARVRPRICWVLTGAGGPSSGMIRDLVASQPVFRAVLERCNSRLAGRWSRSLLTVLEDESTWRQPSEFTPPASYTLQVALAELCRSWGIIPDVVLGMGVGEYAAACLAGAVTIEEGLAFALDQTSRARGVSAESSASRIPPLVHRPVERVLILSSSAAVVEPNQCVPSACWQSLTQPMTADAAFAQSLLDQGCGLLITSMVSDAGLDAIARAWPAQSAVPAVVPLWRPGHEDAKPLAEALAEFFVRGATPDFSTVDRPGRRRKVALPTYPFQRQRYWPSRGSGSQANWEAETTEHPLWGRGQTLASGTDVFDGPISVRNQPYLGDHRVYEQIVMPGAWYVAGALATASVPTALRGVRLVQALVLRDDETRRVQVVVSAPADDGARHFQVFSGAKNRQGKWTLHAEGEVLDASAVTNGPIEVPTAWRNSLRPQTPGEWYAALELRGLKYGSRFRCLQELWVGEGEAVGILALPTSVNNDGVLPLHPVLLDGCFQVLAAALPSDTEGMYVPVRIERLELQNMVGDRLQCRARLRRVTGGEDLTADLQLVDDLGRQLGAITGLVLQRVSPATLLKEGRTSLSDWFYEVAWREQAPTENAATTDFLPKPADLIELTASAGISWDQAKGGVSYAALPNALEAVSAQYALRALAQLGWRHAPGEHVTVAELLRHLALAGRHERFVTRLLALLGAQGWLRQTDSGWVAERMPSTVDPQQVMTELVERFPAYRPELGLLERCGSRLAEVLRGEVDPLTLLFPADAKSNASEVYGQSPAARVFNALIGQVLARVSARLPAGRRLRVLEIGAGTGSTTAALLPLLPADRTDYLFTDLSAGFFAAAEERFADYSFLSYRPLDIERDPQDLVAAGQVFDVVVAANVLHATRDVARSLAHARRLLAPGGLLVLLEGLDRQGWLDLTFGLLPGWWQYADAWRNDYPLLSGEAWCQLLKAQDFQEAEVLAPAADELKYGVIVASAPAVEPVRAPAGTWLVFQDSAGLGTRLGEALRLRGQRCVGVEYGPEYSASPAHYVLPPTDVSACDRLLAEVLVDGAPLAGVVHLWNLDGRRACADDSLADHGEQEAARGCGSALHLVQALVRHQLQPARGLWIVTRGAQATASNEGVAAPGQALVWGLGKVISLEYPELKCRRLDLDPANDANELERLLAELLNGDTETEIALRPGSRRVSRLCRWPSSGHLEVPEGEYQLQNATQGSLDKLRLEPRLLRRPGPGEVAVRIRAAGLNFRDLLNALGMYPGDAGSLGGECSGEVIALGEGVSSLQVGDAVIALAAGSMASRVVVPATLVAPKPTSVTFAQAAGIPIAFCTAALAWARAGLRSGETVLIHAASGGTGLAALQLAQRLGAEVLATASPGKQDFLRAMGVRHVFNSRTTEFADRIREVTGGRGVDVVLNSLTSGDFIAATLSALSSEGRFIEIGKRDIWSAAQMAATRPDVRYEILALDDLLRETPAAVAEVLSRLAAGFERGELRPLPQVVYGLAEAPSAFRLMQQAKHIGKIVLSLPALAESFNSEGTYLITGGLSGLGLAVARRLVERGVRHLGLLSRRPPDATTEAVLSEIRTSGCHVQVLQADVAEEPELRRALAELAATQPPLRGVIHAAGVLDDGALVNLDWTRFARVLAPKVRGAWNLHCLTRHQDLELFVLFSSMTSVLGSAGQANHVAANAYLDALAHARRAAGLAGQSINWGAWSEIGSAAGAEVAAQLGRRGIATIAPEAGLAATEQLLRADPVQVGVLPVDWERFRAQSGDRPAPFFAEMLARGSVANKGTPRMPTTTLRRRLELALPGDRMEILRRHLEAELARILRLDPARRVDPGIGFFDMGMDSLMAVELRNRLQTDCELQQPLVSTALFDYPTLEALTEYLSQQLPMMDRKPELMPDVPQDDANGRRVFEEIKHLSEAETATEIARELSSLVEGAANE